MLRKKGKIITSIIAVLVVGGLGIAGYSFFESKNNKIVAGSSEKETVEIEQYCIPDEEKIFISGKIIPKNTKVFSVKSEQGNLNSIKVEDSQNVLEGEELYSCINDSILEEIDNLKTQINIKEKEKANLKKEDVELKKGIDLEISTLRDSIYKLEEKVHYTEYAPFSGKVYLSNLDNENNAGEIMVLDSTDFFIKGSVNEYDSVKLLEGQEVEILVFATKDKIKGKITNIYNRPNLSVEGESLSYYDVDIEFENQENIKNGMSVQATAKFSDSNLKLPKTAIILENEKHYVYKIENDILRKTEVNVLEVTDEYIVVNSGVVNGDCVVKNLNDITVKDGQSIYGDLHNNNNVETEPSEDINKEDDLSTEENKDVENEALEEKIPVELGF